jgi:hypothetical protein
VGLAGNSGYLDLLGHGTAVMAAIQTHAPGGTEYYAVKVFDQSLRTSSQILLDALAWTIHERMDWVNLSLGTANPEHGALLGPIVERALRAGIQLVAAAGMLPGTLPGVVAVRADPLLPRDRFRRGEDGLIHASPYPRPIPGMAPERNLSGVSFAVANATGLLLAEDFRPTR